MGEYLEWQSLLINNLSPLYLSQQSRANNRLIFALGNKLSILVSCHELETASDSPRFEGGDKMVNYTVTPGF